MLLPISSSLAKTPAQCRTRRPRPRPSHQGLPDRSNRQSLRPVSVRCRPASGSGPARGLHSTLCMSALGARPANVPSPPGAGIVAVPMACFLINMIPADSRLVCSSTFESLRSFHNFSVELTSELAMNSPDDSVPFGTREPIIFGVRKPHYRATARVTANSDLGSDQTCAGTRAAESSSSEIDWTENL